MKDSGRRKVEYCFLLARFSVQHSWLQHASVCVSKSVLEKKVNKKGAIFPSNVYKVVVLVFGC